MRAVPFANRIRPAAAASLRKGIEKTLTVIRPGVLARLRQTLGFHQPDKVSLR